MRVLSGPGLKPAGQDTDSADEPFVPLPQQDKILRLLDGKAHKADTIARETGLARRKLFKDRNKKGWLAELVEHDLVRKHRQLGYYRPDKPPPELADQLTPEGH